MNTLSHLLRLPGARSLVAAGLVARIPMGVTGLGITLMVLARTDSYGLAGAVIAANMLAMALVAPLGARLTDRIGQARALPRLIAVHGSCLLALVAAIALGSPWWTWLLLAATAGASVPMIGSMTRARWAKIVESPEQRSSAFALESVADEVAFVLGPVIASVLALAVFPAAPVLLGLVALVLGGAWLVRLRGSAPDPAPAEPGHAGHVLRYPGMVAMVVLMLCLGGLFGSLQVATVAFAMERAAGLTGVLLGLFSFGSLVSGVLLGLRTRTWSLSSQVRAGATALPVALLLLALSSGPAWFAPLAFASGLCVSVVMIGSFGLVERIVPSGRLTESLSTAVAGIALGGACGSWAAGTTVDAFGVSWALLLVVAFAATGAAGFWLRAQALADLEEQADRESSVTVPVA